MPKDFEQAWDLSTCEEIVLLPRVTFCAAVSPEQGELETAPELGELESVEDEVVDIAEVD